MSDTRAGRPPKARPLSPSELASYSDLFSRLADPVFLVDPASLVIIEINSACQNVLGWPADKLVGRSILQLVEEGARSDFSKGLRVAMRRYHPRRFESQWNPPEGVTSGRLSLHVEIQACPLKLSNGTEILQVVARDISFRREVEQQMDLLLQDIQASASTLEELSQHDGLTGLYNRRCFEELLQSEYSRSSRFQQPFSVVFCDVDHFKRFNDSQGHAAGDELLKKIAGVVRDACRNTDWPARYGGEELVILCPSSTAEQASVLAERIRIRVEKAFGGATTLSIGVASFPDDARTAHRVVELADEAMYASKRGGRNRVTLASSAGSGSGNGFGAGSGAERAA